MRFSYASKTA